MTPAGWVVMIVSVGSVLTLVSYCLYRVLTLPPVDAEERRGGERRQFCGSCGKPNPATADHCPSCGMPFQ